MTSLNLLHLSSGSTLTDVAVSCSSEARVNTSFSSRGTAQLTSLGWDAYRLCSGHQPEASSPSPLFSKWHPSTHVLRASSDGAQPSETTGENGAADSTKEASKKGSGNTFINSSKAVSSPPSAVDSSPASPPQPFASPQTDAPSKSPSTSSKRAGLHRTPISGGVQSATSAHGLPTPAIAVRNLIEQARFAHLCTIMSRMHHRRRGYPFGSLVDFAPDENGHPIFSLSPLAIHTRNLLADPRATLVVQIPGWSGLANARVTIFGDVLPLPADRQEWAQKLYMKKHQHGASQQWGNFYFYRMESISDIYFVGGFGTVAWVDVKEYLTAQPDRIAASNAEITLQELNGRFSKDLKKMLAAAQGQQDGWKGRVDDAALISIDSKGVDIRVRQGAQFSVQRMSFVEGHAVETLDEATVAMERLIYKGVEGQPF